MSVRPYLLVAGCSHTQGVGVDPDQTWAHQLAVALDLDLVNLGRESACAKFVSDTLINYLHQASAAPLLVIAQWPNPYRSMKVIDQKIHFYNVNSIDQDFKQRLKNDPNSFVDEWRHSIVQFNTYCSTRVVNICLETKQDFIIQPVQYLLEKNIILHTDEKLPGKTWHFDSAARDGRHHSHACHKKWAERLLTILQNPV